MVYLGNLEDPVPRPVASVGWQADVDALLTRYEAAPLLTPGDERLGPIFGGVATLAYYGSDLGQKALDQQLPLGWHVPGRSVEAACTETAQGNALAPELRPALDQASASIAAPAWPPFVSVWFPISVAGGMAAPGARCDEFGQPIEAARFGHFCVFGRLALQPAGNRPLIVVVHGLFDSSAQEYVQRIAAVLYGLGHSVLLPDMRDHGDTWRAAPQIATTLGTLEGRDTLALVRAVRLACGPRVSTAGAVGVSGGGLDVIRAFSEDRQGTLDAGVAAISPLIDAKAAMREVGERGRCPVTRAIELTLPDEIAVGGISAAAFFGGAALVQGLEGRRVDSKTAIAAGVGAGVGFLSALAIDAWFDGGSSACVSQKAIGGLFADVLQARWRALRRRTDLEILSPAGRRIEPDLVTFEDYMRERASFLAKRTGSHLRVFDAGSLADDLRRSLTSGRPQGARLLVIGADDDPVTRRAPLIDFAHRTRGSKEIYVRSLDHGGHGAMWVVQPAIMQRVFARFFGDPARAPAPTRSSSVQARPPRPSST